MISRMNEFIGIVLNNYDSYLVRLGIVSSTNFELISEKFLDLYLRENIFTFFVEAKIDALVSDIQSNDLFIRTVLDLTDLVVMDARFQDISISECIDSIVDSVCYTRTSTENSLLMTQTTQLLNVNAVVLKTLLRDNIWLLMIYVLIAKYDHTEAYKAYKEK